MNIVITIYLIGYYIISFDYFLVAVRGYHWIPTPRINIYFLNVNVSQCFLVSYKNNIFKEPGPHWLLIIETSVG